MAHRLLTQVLEKINKFNVNHASVFTNMLENMLTNASKCDPDLQKILKNYEFGNLVMKIYKSFFVALIFIQVLASWKNGYVYHVPFGLYKVSDAHCFQLLTNMYGIEKATTIYCF